jgi:hypothetical protein
MLRSRRSVDPGLSLADGKLGFERTFIFSLTSDAELKSYIWVDLRGEEARK